MAAVVAPRDVLLIRISRLEIMQKKIYIIVIVLIFVVACGALWYFKNKPIAVSPVEYGKQYVVAQDLARKGNFNESLKAFQALESTAPT